MQGSFPKVPSRNYGKLNLVSPFWMSWSIIFLSPLSKTPTCQVSFWYKETQTIVSQQTIITKVTFMLWAVEKCVKPALKLKHFALKEQTKNIFFWKTYEKINFWRGNFFCTTSLGEWAFCIEDPNFEVNSSIKQQWTPLFPNPIARFQLNYINKMTKILRCAKITTTKISVFNVDDF